MASEQRTTPEMRRNLRQQMDWTGRGLHLWRYEAKALLDDADALAGALAEVARLRKAIDDALYFHAIGSPFGMLGVLRRAALAPGVEPPAASLQQSL